VQRFCKLIAQSVERLTQSLWRVANQLIKPGMVWSSLAAKLEVFPYTVKRYAITPEDDMQKRLHDGEAIPFAHYISDCG